MNLQLLAHGAHADLPAPTCCLLQAVGSKAGSLCCPDSQVNPVQSVSNSAFFSAAVADDDGDGDDGSLLEAGQEELSGFGASKESSYASMLQVGASSRRLTKATSTTAYFSKAAGGTSRAASRYCTQRMWMHPLLQDGNTPASPSDPLSDGQLASSVLNIIDSLYGGTAAAASSSHAWQQQQQLSLQDQPLREMLVVAAPQHAAASEAEQAAAEAAPPGIPDTAGSQAAGQLQQVCSNVCRPDSPGSLSTDEEAGGAADVQAADPEQHEQRQQEESADTAADEPSAAGGDSRASSDATSSADGKALLASMDGLLAERSKLQQELSGYLQQLGSQEDGEGEPLVLLAGQAYALLVERLLREGRAQQYRALHGWEGPHRCVGVDMLGTAAAAARNPSCQPAWHVLTCCLRASRAGWGGNNGRCCCWFVCCRDGFAVALIPYTAGLRTCLWHSWPPATRTQR